MIIIKTNGKYEEGRLMLQRFYNDQENETKGFRQKVADPNIQQSIEERQDEIQHAKNGFVGMLAGILVGGIVGWLFLGPTDNGGKEKEIPVIRRPILAAKVQPNDPGGMEIDNQNREIYHIVDNIAQEKKEINIIPAPEMPKIVTENAIKMPENIENLVESIEEEGSLNAATGKSNEEKRETIQNTNLELSAIKTNSNEKIIIPEKLKNIEVKLQKNINSGKVEEKVSEIKEEKEEEKKISKPETKSIKGTWYAQIIASSSRKAVETLWEQLSKKHGFLQEYTHEIEEIKAANGSTLYRLKVGAFKTRKEAEGLSDKLKQKQISCIIKQN